MEQESAERVPHEGHEPPGRIVRPIDPCDMRIPGDRGSTRDFRPEVPENGRSTAQLGPNAPRVAIAVLH